MKRHNRNWEKILALYIISKAVDSEYIVSHILIKETQAKVIGLKSWSSFSQQKNL